MSVEQVLSFNAKNRQKRSTKTVGKIKYQNPADPEQTWTGRGKQPNWLKDALERGAQKEDFLIE
jgi:DNA-binding protein H-NS